MAERLRIVLLYAQDTQGLGHISRTLTIARHLLSAQLEAVVYIVTKSPIAGIFSLPERCDYIKLPRRITPAAVLQTEGEREAAKQRFRVLRSRLLLDTALELVPDLVLVDHEPLGFAGEFRDGLYVLKERHPGTRFIFGLRDIMDEPASTRTQWHELGVYDALEHLYDGIAVYGWPALYDVAEAYALPASTRTKLHYCGYIVRDLPTSDPAEVRQKYGLPETGPLVVATVGSGSDGYPVLAATLTTLEYLRERYPNLLAILVTGPFMPADQQARLHARATTAWRIVTQQADTFALMAASDAIVSMGGYNSVCEALAVARPLIIVPRMTHKVEQKIRADVLASRGLACSVPPDALHGHALADALEWALHSDLAAYAERVRQVIPNFDGAARLTAYLTRWLAPERNGQG